MKKAIVEKLSIRSRTPELDNGTFTGVVEWEKDLHKAYIRCGNFQNVPESFDREELQMDEACDGTPYCLFID